VPEAAEIASQYKSSTAKLARDTISEITVSEIAISKSSTAELARE